MTEISGDSASVRERIAEALSALCGRCHGKGTERHQVDHDPAAGYAEWTCPSCGGTGAQILHMTPHQAAERVLAALGLEQVGWFVRFPSGIEAIGLAPFENDSDMGRQEPVYRASFSGSSEQVDRRPS